jgi:hypothetical protein
VDYSIQEDFIEKQTFYYNLFLIEENHDNYQESKTRKHIVNLSIKRRKTLNYNFKEEKKINLC